jgi:biotin carboxyl carrier protein
LCSLYACPEDLDPKDACVWSKDVFRASQTPAPEWKQPERTHAFEEHRKVPLEKLVRRLGLEPFDRPAPWQDRSLEPARVAIPLKQHIGVACVPAVSAGDKVEKGQVVGRVPDGELGAPVHASIAGRVKEINDSVVLERT